MSLCGQMGLQRLVLEFVRYKTRTRWCCLARRGEGMGGQPTVIERIVQLASPRRALVAELVLAVSIMPVWGCATPYVMHRWNRSGRVQVAVQIGEVEMPQPSFRWQHWIPPTDAHPSKYSLSSGTAKIEPLLDGCERVDIYVSDGIQTPARVDEIEGSSFLHDGALSHDLRAQLLQAIDQEPCALLLTPGASKDGALIDVLTTSGRVYSAELGRTTHPGWTWALPGALLYDATIGALIIVGMVAGVLVMGWIMGEAEENAEPAPYPPGR